MDNEKKEFSTVDDYIESYTPEVAKRLSALRSVIKEVAPDAQEKISYGMPAYFLNGRLVYFAGFKNHIGFYPLTNAMEVFKDELEVFKTGKGSIQFQHSEPFPLELMKKIVEFRVRENTDKTK